MKTKNLTRLALTLSLATAAPFAMAQKPADDLPKVNTTEGAEQPATADAPDAGGITPGRPVSQPSRPDGKPDPGTAAAQPGATDMTVAAMLKANPSFSTLTSALEAAGLAETLADKQGNFTVFAPTDSAFDKLPAGTLGKLMEPANKEQLRALLLNHVISGRVMSTALKDGSVKTLGGGNVEVEVEGSMVQVDDVAVTKADMAAQNGVVHSIDQVLVPEALEGFADLND